MNAPVLLAQLSGSSPESSAVSKPLKLAKPQSGQAVTVHLDGATKIDFSAISSEKLTFVRIGDRLIILFDNQSTVSIDPVFSNTGAPLPEVSFDMGLDRVLNGTAFAELFPITTDQSVLPAAGTPGAPSSPSGANFGSFTIDALSGGTPLDLLSAEAAGTQAVANQQTATSTPIPGGADTIILNEDGLFEGQPGGLGDTGGTLTSFTGSLNIDFGTDVIGRSLAFAAAQPGLAGLTSGGQAVNLQFTTIDGQPVLIGYTGSDPSVTANQVFIVSLDVNSTIQGSYTVTLLRPLDHPIGGTEDTLSLTIAVIATDGSGDTAPLSIVIGVNDDSPVASTVASTTLVEQTGEGNAFVSSAVTASLGIGWGADNGNSSVDGGSSGAVALGDRSLVFADSTLAALASLGLTSNGEAISYALSADGTSIVASAAGGRAVFTVALSDTDSGSYTFTLLDNLDHVGANGATQPLTFAVVATDADGDPVASSFIVDITDDTPVANPGTASTVEDESLPGGNNEGDGLLAAVSGVSLNIDWNSDDANSDSGQPGDRSVAFTDADVNVSGAYGETLTSLGQVVRFTVLSTGELVGYTGESVPTSTGAANVVLFASLSDINNGEYSFTLVKPLDHAAGNGENTLALTFNYTATDSDGDPSSSTFTVNVVDDVPVAGTGTSATVEDEALSGGNNEDDGFAASVSGVSLNIAWGADDGNDDGGQPGDRSVVFTDADVTVAGGFGEALTSRGQTVQFALLSDGTLVGYTGEAVPTSTSASNVVLFATLSDINNGEYSFTLVKPLDHAAGSDENTLSLTFNYTATDSDGDNSSSTFTVSIVDDVPVVGAPYQDGVVEEEQPIVVGAGNEDFGGAGDADGGITVVGVPIVLNDRTTQSTGGTLAIAWGADDANDGNGQPGDRAVAFTAEGIAALEAQQLTSRGQDIHYKVFTVNGGQVLVAYTGSTEPTSVPSNTNAAIAANVVFTVSLSDSGAGSYNFTLIDTIDHPGEVHGEESLALQFQFTATDSDGDTTAPASFSVKVIDDSPVAVGTILTRTVEEEQLAGGNEDTRGIGDGDFTLFGFADVTTASAGGPLNVFWGGDDSNVGGSNGYAGTQVAGDRSIVFGGSAGAYVADGVISAAVAAQFIGVSGGNGAINLADLTSGGQALVYTLSANGTVLTATAGNQTVFTVTLSDQGSGAYLFNLSGVLDHPVSGSSASQEDALSFTFTFTARDGDGDIARSSFTVNVVDDSPVANTGTASRVEDESLVGGNNETEAPNLGASVSNISLNIAWGADSANDGNGQPGDRSVAFSNANVAVSGAYQGTTLTSRGVAVHTTVLSDGTLVGYTGPTAPTSTSASNVVFFATLSDADSGAYSFTLVKPLDHAAGNGENTLALTFNYTATDSDGDTASNSFTVSIVDDAPVIGTPFQGGVVEEEQWIVVGPGNEDTSGAADGDYWGSFFGIPYFVDATSETTGGTLAIAWGADNANDNNGQPGDRTVSFTAAGIANLQAQLLTSRGETIHYKVFTLNGAEVLVAYTGDTPPSAVPSSTGAAIAANVVFIVGLSDSGNGSYAFTLIDTIDHPGAVQGEDALPLSFGFAATDSDGDTVTSSFTVKIVDDAPEIGRPDDESVREVDLPTTNYDTTHPDYSTSTVQTGDLDISWGADDNNSGAISNRSVAFTTAAGATGLTSDGSPISYSISADGTTLTAVTADSRVVFTVQLSDSGDGRYTFTLFDNIDHPSSGPNDDSLPLTFGFQATDGDGDTATSSFTVTIRDDEPTVGPNTTVRLDDDTLGGNPGGNGDDADAIAKTGTLVHNGGADGTASVLWSSAGLTLPSGFWFEVSADGTVMTITQDQGNGYVPVLTMTITNTTTGAYAVAQVAPIDHPQGTMPGYEDNVQFTVSYIVTDGDGDTKTGTISVNVDDDTPTVGANALIQLDDDALPGGNAGGVGDDVEATVLTGVLSHSGGADGTASVLWAPNGLTLPFGFWFTLSPDSKTMTITQLQDGAYVGVFQATITDTATGAYQITQLAAVKHNTPGVEDNVEISFQYRVTDGDGDVATGTLTVNVDDDTPTASPSTTVWLDDEDLSGGNQGGVGDQTGTPTNRTGMLNHSFGADSNGASISWLATSSSNADNLGFTYEVTNGGSTLLVKQNGTLVYTATVNQQTGAYAISQNAPVKHPAGGDENEVVFQLRYQVTDGDGDTAQSYLWVKVDDDTPTATPSTTVWLDDEDLSGGNPGGIGDQTGTPTNLTGMLNHSFGADSNGASISWLATSSSDADSLGFTYEVTNGGSTLLVKQNGTLVYTATMNQQTGAYAITQNAAIKHPAGGDENEVVFQLRYQVTDGDGDTAQSYLWVKVDDDTPTGGAGTTAWLDDDSLTGGNPDGVGDNALANTSNVLKHSFGADGAGGIAWTGITVSSGGNQADFSSTVLNDGKTLQVYQNGTLVITATLNPLTGQYSLVQNAPIHHVAGGDENQIQFRFLYDVTDGDGDTAAGYIWVNVDDDTATLGPITPGTVTELTASGFSNAFQAQSLSNVSLNISWGADDANPTAGAGAGDRSIAFAASLANAVPAGVTSNGFDLVYLLSADGQTLTAYRYENGHFLNGAGADLGTSPSNSARIFSVSLSDSGSGSYSFTLYDNLDHASGASANTLPLSFGFTATDSDGDATSGSFTVDIVDDVPLVTANAEEGSVEERYLDGPNPTTFGNLAIDWNSDDRNVHLTFTSTTVTDDLGNVLALTSGGVALKYAIVPADGSTNPLDQKLIAYKDGDTPDNPVFTVNLISAGNPSYQFVLYQPLDHTGTYHDTLPLTFSVTGYDGDGDAVTQSLTVTLEDWAPVRTGNAEVGSVEERYLDGPRPSTFGNLAIDWNADDRNVHLTFTSTTVTDDLGNVLALTSGGVALKYAIVPADGSTNPLDQKLIAYKDGDTPDNPVFTVNLISAGNPSYQFVLYQPLDHTGTYDDTLPLTFSVTGYDGDGDAVTQSLTVTVEDWSPQSSDVDAKTIEEAAGSVSTGNVDLEIDFGADGDSAGASVTFVSAGPLTVKTQDGNAVSLTSLGVGLSYVLSADGATLTAYRFNGTDYISETGVSLGSDLANASDAAVFTVTLSDAGTGSYNFTLLQPLDHPSATGSTQQLTLNFGFRIEDADGDDDFTNSFSVIVDAAGAVSTGYTAPDSAVFVNMSETSQTVDGQTVAAHSVTDRASVTDRVVGLDRLGSITMADGGSAGDILIGGAGNNKLFGNGGDDTLIGGGGLNTIQGGTGNDTIIYAVATGGADTVDGGADTDTQIINGTAAAETFNINAISLGGNAYLAANIDASAAAATNSNFEVATTAVEEWSVNGGAGGDTFNISGPLLGTGIATSTLTINGDVGNDTLDLTGYAHDVRIVSDGGADADTVKFAFKTTDATYAKVFAQDGVTLIGVEVTYNGVTSTFTNYESFVFTDGTRSPEDLVNSAPVFTSTSSGHVTEDFSYTVPLTERVTNGSFEGPTSAARLNGWTTSNIDLISEPHSGSTSVGVYQGTGSLTQTIQTVAGVTYNLRFWASNPFDTVGEIESLNVTWGGQTVFTQGNIPGSGAYANYTLYSISVVATGSSTTFSIAMQDTKGWWVLDDVSVTAVFTPGVETASGTLGFSDPDIGNVHQVSYTPAASGYYGTFTPVLTDSATADGQGTITWTYTVNDSEIQHLAAGQTVTQTYAVSIDDGHGGVTTQNVDVLLHGTNDAPVAVGDTISMTLVGVPPAVASSTPTFNETENNNTRAQANVINRSALKIASNANLTDPTDPSITVKGSINSSNTVDYFAISLKAGEKLILDIDNPTGSLDAKLWLFDSSGTQLGYDDDSSNSVGGGGSTSGLDPYVTYTATSDGTYYIAVGRFSGSGNYDLQVSIDNMQTYTGSPLTVAAADLLANDYDVDNGDTFTIVSVSGQGVALVNGDVVVQPGVTSFTYTVRDSNGAESTATVQVDQIIVDPNDAPVLTGPGVALASLAEDAGAPVGAVGTKVSDLVDLPGNGGHDNVTDADAGAVTGIALTATNAANGTWWYSLDNGATWSTVGNVSTTQALLLSETARLYFQPNADWNGTLTNAISYRAWDETSGTEGAKLDTSVNGGTSAFSTAEVSSNLTVDPVNDAPQIHAPTSITVDEDGTFTFAGSDAITFSDVDGDVALSGLISVTNGTLTLAGVGTGSTISFGPITISQINALLANGVFTPTPNSDTSAQIQIQIADNGNVGGGGLIAAQTITIDINPVEDAPVAAADSVTATEDTPLVVSAPAQGVLANDSDPDTGDTISVVAGDYATSGGGVVHFDADGTYSYTPKANFNGIDTVEYTITDASGATDTATLTIEVAPVNDAPQIHAPSSITVDEDGTFTFAGSDAVTFSDVDGDVALSGLISVTNGTLTLAGVGTGSTISFGPMTISQINALLANGVFTPTPNSDTSAQIQIQIADNGNVGGGSLTATQTITIDINPVNDAPVTTPVTLAAIAEDSGARLITQAQLLANASDVEGGPLTVSNLQLASGNGTLVNNNNGTWTYTPALNDDTAVSFSYTVSDGTDSVAGSATMDITPVNDLPVARNDNPSGDAPGYTITENTIWASFNAIGNDTLDPDAGAPNSITIGAITVPTNYYGITASDLSVTVDPDNKIRVELLGTDWQKLANGAFMTIPISYTLHGDGADASTAQMIIRVTGVNDAPVLDVSKSPAITVAEDAGAPSFAGKVQVSSLAGLSGIGNVTDVDGYISGIAITGANAANGTWSWSIDGTTWFPINAASLSDSNALLLYGNYYVYFQPAAGFDGTVSNGLTIRAWDQSAGTPGSYANTTTNGGSTAFSSATDTVVVTVTPSNDAPDFGNGVVAGSVTQQVGVPPASVLTNGGFESGSAGWTASSTEGGSNFGSGFPGEGSYNFTANSFGVFTAVKAQLAQTVSTLPGVQYTLTFSVATTSETPDAHVYVNWNGQQVAAIASGQASGGGYQTFTVAVTGTGSDTLQFVIDDANNPATFDAWYLDAVALTPTAHYESTSGTISFSDDDVADVHSVSVTTPQGSSYVGHFVPVVDQAGNTVNWTFYASDAEMQGLPAASVDQVYTLTISDGNGGFDTQDVTVTLVKHVNSAPVITSSAQTGVETEDASLGVVNLVQNPTFELPDVFNPVLTPWSVSGGGATIYGSGANGSINSLYLSPESSISQTLTTVVGQTYTVNYFLQNGGTPFSVSVNGAAIATTNAVHNSWTEYSVTFVASSTSTVLSFGTTGVNGASLDEISVQAGTSHVVAGIESSKGTITYSDANLVDTHTVTAGGPTFSWSGGSLSQAQIDALTTASSLALTATDSVGTGTGSVAWKHSIADSAIQFLGAGQTLTGTYTVSIDDGRGGVTSQQVAITINGVNDDASISGVANGTVKEDGTLTAGGTLTVSDADSGQSLFQTPSSLAGLYGTFTFNASTGAWGYTLNNSASNVQNLNTNEVVHDTLVVTSSDGTASRTIDVTIQGTSEVPASSLTVADTTSAAGRYAFPLENPNTQSTPRQIAFDATSLFSGGTGPVSYSYTLVSSPSDNSGWLTLSGNQFSGTPGGTYDDVGQYVYRVTATDSIGSVSTYVAFSALYVDSWRVEIASNSNAGDGNYNYSDALVVTGNVTSTVASGGADDVVVGGTGNNSLDGGTENDAIYGMAGNDTLVGGVGSDFIDGGAGDDTITGGLNNDVLIGGSGNDTFNYGINDGNDIIDGGSGTDTLAITGTNTVDAMYAYLTAGVITQIDGTVLTNVETITANLGNGTDRLEYVTSGAVSVNLGASTATGFTSIASIENVTGGSGNDTLIGSSSANILVGGEGNDTIRGGGGNDTIDGGAGIDLLDFSDATAGFTLTLSQGSTSTSVNLGSVGLGNDSYKNMEGVIGSNYNDTLSGSGNADLLIGGRGSDQLTGNGGIDTFRWLSGDLNGGGVDSILDFQSGTSGDIIDLSGLLSGLSGNHADAVRFVDGGGHTSLASANGSSVLNDGDLTLQVNLGSGWTDVATIKDTGSNLSGGDDVIKMIIDNSQAQLQVHV